MSLRGNVKYHQHYGNVRVTGPAKEPVTLKDFKDHLKIENNEEDLYLEGLIVEAREEIEDRAGLALISQTWQMTLDGWTARGDQWWDGVRDGHINSIHGGPPAAVDIIRYPLISVDTVNVYDEASNATAVTIASTFDVDTNSRPGRLALQAGVAWPVAERPINAVEINYTAGYGTAVSDVPTPLVRAVRNMASYLYAHRGDGCSPEEAYRKSGAESTVRMYRAARI